MVSPFYLVVPDGAVEPTAAFAEIADAIAWGLARYGSDRFTIRSAELAAPGITAGHHPDA